MAVDGRVQRGESAVGWCGNGGCVLACCPMRPRVSLARGWVGGHDVTHPPPPGLDGSASLRGGVHTSGEALATGWGACLVAPPRAAALFTPTRPARPLLPERDPRRRHRPRFRPVDAPLPRTSVTRVARSHAAALRCARFIHAAGPAIATQPSARRPSRYHPLFRVSFVAFIGGRGGGWGSQLRGGGYLRVHLPFSRWTLYLLDAVGGLVADTGVS